MYKKPFAFIKQLDSQDCSFACLKMVGKSYNKEFNIDNDTILNSNIIKQGILVSDVDTNAKKLGFETLLVDIDLEGIIQNAPLPAIFQWNQNHFVTVYKITSNKIYVADPAFGKTTYSKKDFLKGWTQGRGNGIALLLEPTDKIYNYKKKTIKEKKVDLKYITRYLKKHKKQFFLISLTLLLSSCIELVFPFFTQKIIDKGVAFKDINFIYMVLIAQIFVFISRISLEYYRSWLFIHISSRISLSIISDFLIKMMKLPIKFFTSKNIGDLIQRIQDHKRIENFLSEDLIQVVFSFFSIIIYSSILFYFNTDIFLVVFISTLIELIWIFSFLKKIRINDHKNFAIQSEDQNKIYEFINAVQEIKLNNLEEQKTNQWQHIQKNLYLNNIERLKINQKYESYRFINFFQVIIVVFIASIAVMNKELTIGTMLSIMFILGGLNKPISQFINFVLQYELVKVSFERLNEIHNKKDEENLSKITKLDEIEDIILKDVSFSYDNKSKILKNINLIIPKNKTTAIVGVSGSGKTSLLKLILKFYTAQTGLINIGKHGLNDINNQLWRKKCGVILQDSTIFSETIKYNIALEENVDFNKLYSALKLANIKSFVDTLPLKENTIIGDAGIGISQGQRQRLLIARAIYKDPDYLFFDEATNSLDSENEKIIVNNINTFFKNKTMIVVAHRLSTVKNADQIIVLDNGVIIEKGTHNELIKLKGKYFNLIKNQLELGQ
ncbi:peptidase domain-containing ABC transporter [Olleya sp. Bg11-27]|uniref:peptidase domain-containing ABC transporter n=1 Tax=Olleya sp. Bg11-27 TaxID=2058135 RepID=UPI000C30ADF9|nr:peptidase domain-containing ABC transporter [Olleya sp. Bg11-27]AUC77549.1 ABC transporter ATP-binding protein [Olleya sp. Bg11-27]